MLSNLPDLPPLERPDDAPRFSGVSQSRSRKPSLRRRFARMTMQASLMLTGVQQGAHDILQSAQQHDYNVRANNRMEQVAVRFRYDEPASATDYSHIKTPVYYSMTLRELSDYSEAHRKDHPVFTTLINNNLKARAANPDFDLRSVFIRVSAQPVSVSQPDVRRPVNLYQAVLHTGYDSKTLAAESNYIETFSPRDLTALEDAAKQQAAQPKAEPETLYPHEKLVLQLGAYRASLDHMVMRYTPTAEQQAAIQSKIGSAFKSKTP